MQQPLVSVVTPVYNGAAFIRQCIESVLAQTYEHWHYVIVDNCSDDGTSEIIAEYMSRDPRLSAVTHDTLLPAIDNLNFAMNQVSTRSTYCQVVHADDTLAPTCIERKVALAEQYPTAAIVGSYVRYNDRVAHKGLPGDLDFFPGAFVAKETLKGNVFTFLNPTTLLLRSNVVLGRRPFYPDVYHGDVKVCYEILLNQDFAFAHDVLVTVGVHDRSLTSQEVRPLNRLLANRLEMLVEYGPQFLDSGSYAARVKAVMDAYYLFLARSVLQCRDAQFWDLHKSTLSRCGYPLSIARLLRFVAQRICERPGRSLKQLALGVSRSVSTKAT